MSLYVWNVVEQSIRKRTADELSVPDNICTTPLKLEDLELYGSIVAAGLMPFPASRSVLLVFPVTAEPTASCTTNACKFLSGDDALRIFLYKDHTI